MVQWADIKNYYISLQSLTRGKICCELWRTWEAFVSCVIKFHIFNTTIKKINDSFSGSLQWHFSGSLSFIVYRTIHSSYDNCMWFAWMSFFLSSSLSLKTRRDILISFQSAKYNKNIKFSWVLKRRIKKCIFLISMRWNDNVCKKNQEKPAPRRTMQQFIFNPCNFVQITTFNSSKWKKDCN